MVIYFSKCTDKKYIGIKTIANVSRTCIKNMQHVIEISTFYDITTRDIMIQTVWPS